MGSVAATQSVPVAVAMSRSGHARQDNRDRVRGAIRCALSRDRWRIEQNRGYGLLVFLLMGVGLVSNRDTADVFFR